MSRAATCLVALVFIALATHALAQPRVLLTAPAPGTQYLAPVSLSLTAQATLPATHVEFLANGAPIGAAAAQPYSVVWSNAPLGTHLLQARVHGTDGTVSLSPPVPIQVTDRDSGRVNAAPSVQLTSPASGTVVTAPASVALAAAAADSDGTVTRVDFYQGGTLVGSSASAPYGVTLANLAGGTYAFLALAFDDLSAVASSSAATVTVNIRPTVSIAAPAADQIFHAPADVTITAEAADPDGTIRQVDFYDGATLVGTATSSPFSVTLSSAAVGAHSLTAVATDNHGATATSAPTGVIVNALPSIALLSPGNNATFKAPAAIPISVEALDTDGSIASVEFFFGDTLITTRTGPPFNFTWTEVPEGTYSLTARVTDNLGGAATSTAITTTVTAAVAKLYFIHVDHLNTPRLVANKEGQIVWRWDQQEPFGANVPDENPSGLGAFELPLRYPGQYFDKETNLHYNYFRDYDPTLGRYLESDPIGLGAGINTYAYVLSNTLSYADPFGLEINVCYYSDAAAGFGHIGYAVGSERDTFGFHPTGNPFGSPGIIKQDSYALKECKEIKSTPDQDKCMLACRAQRKSDPGVYNLTTNQCTSFVRDCLIQCGLPAGNTTGSPPRNLFLRLPGKVQ